MNTADKLRKFRQQCEREAETSATEIEAPLSHLLHDVCRILNLPAKQRRRVLGRKSYVRLEDTRNCRVDLADRDS
ncbi:MAG: hypothetical protein M1305_02065 [Candidatus Marsarchaeota archaeon]|nr:hypothetical protein [Candidatus Marsarchaeota archaeon]